MTFIFPVALCSDVDSCLVDPTVRSAQLGRLVRLFFDFTFGIGSALVLDHGIAAAGSTFPFQRVELGFEFFELFFRFFTNLYNALLSDSLEERRLL